MFPYQCMLWFLALLASHSALAVTIEGLVLRDDSGSPLVSAEVRIAREGDSLLAAHLETGRDGRFRAENLPAGRYSLTVAKHSFLEVALDVPADFAPIQVRLIRLASISGVVRTRDGNPLPKARVYVMERTRSGAIRELRLNATSTTSKDDGSYSLRGLPPGNYVLAMGHQGNERSGGGLYPDNSAPHRFELKGGEAIDGCDFVAEAGTLFKVQGKVHIPEHLAKVPLASAPAGTTMAARFSVGLAPADQPVVQIAWTRTEEDGSFQLPAVPWGNYELFAAGPIMGFSFRGNILARDGGLAFGRMRVQVTADTSDLNVSVQQPRTARLQWQQGRASNADCPKTLDVRLAALEAWGSDLERTVSLPLGEVVAVENLAPARYSVESASTSAACSVVGAVQLDLRDEAPPEPVVVNAAGKGSLAGEVLERRTGASYQVVLVPLGAAAGEAISVQSVDGQGVFRFDSLRPGRYGVAVRLSGSSSTNQSANVSASLTEVEVLGGQVEILLNAPLSEGIANP